jgi:membrane associated rhomboid family serine protease
MKIRDEIRVTFSGREHLLRLMLINAVVFLFFALLKLLAFLGLPGEVLRLGQLLELPSNLHAFFLKPWTLFTYMFVHYNFMHVVFNLLVMYWTGRIFCEFQPQKRLTAIYILGGLFGGIAFVLLYNIIPAFEAVSNLSVLIGASAGVFAIMVASAMMAPNYPVQMLLFGEIKLKYVAIALTILYLVSIPDSNSGGNIAHLGGGLIGLFYIQFMNKGINLGIWIEFLLDLPSKMTTKKIKVVHSNTSKRISAVSSKTKMQQDVIDAILDKISKSGYDSLTSKEKEILFKASGDSKDPI